LCYNNMMNRFCKKHGLVKHLKRKDGIYRCASCASEWVVNNRKAKKERLVKLFGGKCTLCGYKTYVGALDFHHINPEEKEFTLSVKGLCYSWTSILKEAKKCIIVCKNCHAEIGVGIKKI